MVEKYSQDNGLTVMMEPSNGVISVSVGLWIKTGSRDELPEQYGYAHFVEHMLFKGTEKYSAEDIARMVDRVGGQHNAATNREYTCYYINVVSDYLELALEILSDMFYNSLFDIKEIEKEKKVVIEEIKMYEDTPDEYVHDIFMESMLAGHSTAHPILGTVKGIKSLTRKSLMDFYNQHYKNGNAVLSIAGNFDIKKTKELVSKKFNKQDNIIEAPSIEFQTPKRLFSKTIFRDLEQVHFCLGLDGISRLDKDRWPLYILNTIIGGSMSSRLFQNIREKEGISYSIYSFNSSFIDTGVFGIYCATLPSTYKRAIELIIKECRLIVDMGITHEELEDIKTYIGGNLALSMESTEVRMGQIAKNEIVYGKIYNYQDMMNMIKAVTIEDIQRVIKRLLVDKKFSFISVGGIKEKDLSKISLEI